MTKTATIHFTRSLHDDLDVLRDAGLADTPDGLEKQLLSEFSNYLDTSKWTVEGRENIGADTYRFNATIDLSTANQSDPDAILANLVETLQRPYTEDIAAGHFEIISITINGQVHDAQALLNARLSSGPTL